MKKAISFASLSIAQKVALASLHTLFGSRWRSELRSIWDFGTDANNPPLRQLRNNVGPSAIARIKTSDIKAHHETMRRERAAIAAAANAMFVPINRTDSIDEDDDAPSLRHIMCQNTIPTLTLEACGPSKPAWTVDADINQYLSDAFVSYRTLRYCGLVRGQILASMADAVCAQMNAGKVDGGANS